MRLHRTYELHAPSYISESLYLLGYSESLIGGVFSPVKP